MKPETPMNMSKIAAWPRALLALLLLAPLLAACGSESDLDSVTATVGLGSRLLVVRLPATTDDIREDIVVTRGDAAPDATWRALRGPAGRALTESGVVTDMRLEPFIWQPLRTLHQDWCFLPPSFSSVPEGEPFYEVGLRCTTAQRFVVPPDELPLSLRNLIRTVPSPLDDTATERP